MRPALLLALAALAGIAAPGCAPGGAAQRSDTGPLAGGASQAEAPGAVALAPLGARTSPCRTDSIGSPELHAWGLRRSLEFGDQPAGRARWERRVLLEVDSAGRPRRFRALAGTTPATPDAHRAVADDTLDFVQAWLGVDGHVESGLVGRWTLDMPPRHHYWTGDPLPATLHRAVTDFARAALERCSR